MRGILQLGRTCTSALIFVFACVLASTSLYAQDATVIGTVVDESKAVLPGVIVTATALATGRQFVDVTSERGEYRLVGVPPGQYKLQAELAGFSTTVLTDVELLVGQNATITFTLKLATVSESVTVTGETPLVDTRQAQVAGNVDRRQMEALPISGRNWMELSMMVKGITANTISTNPGTGRTAAFRVNLDGQEITQETSVPGFGQPRVSRDAIAEYQVVTNMFDVTMGRSVGLQVQAISRAGTNDLTGSLFGYFRDDAFNAKDHFKKEVLPYSNQQVGGALGGPIVKDKLQYFASYEYERQPETSVLGPSAYGGQTISLPSKTNQHYALARGDYQLNNRDHLVLRSTYWRWLNTPQFATHPSRAAHRIRYSNFTAGNWSRVVSNSLLQEVKVNYFHYRFFNEPLAAGPITPEYVFPGLTLGPNWNYPEDWNQDAVTTRFDLSWHKGSHDLKIGNELRLGKDSGWWEARSRGQMFFSRLPADAAQRFPLDAWNNPSRWDFSGLDSIATRYDIYYAERGGQNQGHGNWSYHIDRPMYGGWIGDTWAVNNRVTLNLGVRYDVAWKDFIAPGLKETELLINNGKSVENWGYSNDIRDLNNVAPRVGFTWNVNGRGDLVLRGGTGLFFSTAGGNQIVDQQLWNSQRVIANSYVNDGRPGFVQDPTRGVTEQDVLSGKVPLAPQSISVMAHDYQVPYTWQSILGFQKQLSEVMGFDADLVYYKGYKEDVQLDPNLFYDPTTNLPRNPNRFGRPRPDFGPINAKASTGYSDHLALASSMTRRYRNNFQLGLTYTLMFFKRDTGIGNSGYGNQQLNPFDLSMDWARSSEFQRHTVNANGVWNLPGGFAFAGSFHYGSGNYSTITSPSDPLGQVLGARRVRADLSVIPRNTFKGDPWQTLDLRVAKDIRLRGDLKLTGIAEVFNVYHYARFNRNTIDGNRNFGLPTSAGNNPRTGQFAFRISW